MDIHTDSVSANIVPAITSSALERGSPQQTPRTTDAASSAAAAVTTPRLVTLSDLTDFRAAQRTFDLAYSRTALGELCFAVLVLKVFQPKFQVIGLLYTLLCLGHVFVAAWRRKLAAGNERHWRDLQIISNSSTSPDAPALIAQEVARDQINTSERLDDVSAGGHNGFIAQGDVAVLAESSGETTAEAEETTHPASQTSLWSAITKLKRPASDRQADEGGEVGATVGRTGGSDGLGSTSAGEVAQGRALVRVFNDSFRTAGDVVAVITTFTVFLQVAIVFSLYET